MKIAISGTHCSGKTELLGKLIPHISSDCRIIHELARQEVPRYYCLIRTQLSIMNRQIDSERGKEDFLSDRSVFDNYAYVQLTHLTGRLVQGRKPVGHYRHLATCEMNFQTHIRERPYDLIIFVDEMLPLELDGFRSPNVHIQSWIYEYLKYLYFESEYSELAPPIIRVRGSTEKRLNTVLSYLKELEESGGERVLRDSIG